MSKKLKLFVDGRWRTGGDNEVIPVLNPATEEVVAELCMANAADLDEVIASAERGFDTWRQVNAADRAALIRKTAALLRERVEDMARVLTVEQGKTLAQSRWEINGTAAYFDDLADCGEHVYGRNVPKGGSGVTRSVVYEPIGPVFAVAPWNLPAMLPGRKIATALAAGCAVIVKPAKETPETTQLIARCCQDAGIPDGVVNVISGPSGMLSEKLIASPVIRKISFTGSTGVGKQLAGICGLHMKKATMELGGHAPVIVFADADIDAVVEKTVAGRYSNAGQSCIAPTRFFVERAAYEAFVDGFSARVKKLRVGNGLDDGVAMGPLASERRVPVMEQLVADALGHGAELTAGGGAMDGKGYFFEPTVLRDVPDSAEIMVEEPFGPITPIDAFDDVDEVLARANGTPYGLASYVFTNSLPVANRVSANLQAGMVGLNSLDVAAPPVPFGGVKDSGTGREGSIEGVLESMVSKTISTAV